MAQCRTLICAQWPQPAGEQLGSAHAWLRRYVRFQPSTPWMAVRVSISSWLAAAVDASAKLATDAELVAAIQHGAPDEAEVAWTVLFDRSVGPLERAIAARGLVRSEIEEVLQETWTRALARIATYEERGLPFAAWLCGIARNVILERGRHRLYPWPEGFEPVSTDSTAGDPLEQVVSEDEIDRQRAALRAAMAGLSSDQQTVVEGRRQVVPRGRG